MTKTRTFNDNSHSFKRGERRMITNDGHNGPCQHRFLLQVLVLLLLLCFVLGVLPQHYFPWTFRLIFFQRVPFRCVFLESMLEFGVF